VEVSALKHAGPAGLHARSPLLRLQSDDRLVALTRRGNHGAFEALVARYQSRLLAFCRHMLTSREDAEDVLQEVFAAAFNAMLADSRPINVRPWLYRIARNRCLNHLRRTPAIGVDSMDVHFSEHGLTAADQVHRREEFRLLIGDVQGLPETQRTALLLREIDALSYEQIAEAMETTIPSVKSLLVRARVSLAEAAEARQLTCEEVREELGEVAEGLRRTTPPIRRHLRACDRCTNFRRQLGSTNKALASLYPVAPMLLLKKTFLAHLGTTAAAGGTTAAAGGTTAAAGAAAGGALHAGLGAMMSKAAAGLAAAAIVTAGAVEVRHVAGSNGQAAPAVVQSAPAAPPDAASALSVPASETVVPRDALLRHEAPATRAATAAAERERERERPATSHENDAMVQAHAAAPAPAATPAPVPTPAGTPTPATAPGPAVAPAPDTGRIQEDGDTTVLAGAQQGEPAATAPVPAADGSPGAPGDPSQPTEAPAAPVPAEAPPVAPPAHP
jgi:RNA polymerase sigma factor (sigma-70 family)